MSGVESVEFSFSIDGLEMKVHADKVTDYGESGSVDLSSGSLALWDMNVCAKSSISGDMEFRTIPDVRIHKHASRPGIIVGLIDTLVKNLDI